MSLEGEDGTTWHQCGELMIENPFFYSRAGGSIDYRSIEQGCQVRPCYYAGETGDHVYSG